MSVTNIHAATLSLQADDAEIGRYGMLLDCLGIGLLAYAADGTICLGNEQARSILNDGPASFTDENGHLLSEDSQPAALVLSTGRTIQKRVLGINDAGAANRWVETSTLPVFSVDGQIRRVLLTLSDISQQHWLEAQLEQLSIRDPLTDAFNRRHTLRLLDEECQRFTALWHAIDTRADQHRPLS